MHIVSAQATQCQHASPHLSIRQGGSITSRLAATCSGSGISEWRSHCWCVASMCLGAELLLLSLQPVGLHGICVTPCAASWRLTCASLRLQALWLDVWRLWSSKLGVSMTSLPAGWRAPANPTLPLIHLLNHLRLSSAWRHRTTESEVLESSLWPIFAMQGAICEGQLRLSGTPSCAAGMWVVIRWWYRTQYAPAKHGPRGSSSAGSETKLTTWLRSKGQGSASTNSSGGVVHRARRT